MQNLVYNKLSECVEPYTLPRPDGFCEDKAGIKRKWRPATSGTCWICFIRAISRNIYVDRPSQTLNRIQAPIKLSISHCSATIPATHHKDFHLQKSYLIEDRRAKMHFKAILLAVSIIGAAFAMPLDTSKSIVLPFRFCRIFSNNLLIELQEETQDIEIESELDPSSNSRYWDRVGIGLELKVCDSCGTGYLYGGTGEGNIEKGRGKIFCSLPGSTAVLNNHRRYLYVTELKGNGLRIYVLPAYQYTHSQCLMTRSWSSYRYENQSLIVASVEIDHCLHYTYSTCRMRSNETM